MAVTLRLGNSKAGCPSSQIFKHVQAVLALATFTGKGEFHC
jgi:hypothetical protein